MKLHAVLIGLATAILLGSGAAIADAESGDVESQTQRIKAQNQKTFRVGYIEFPPVFSTNEAGQPEGYLIELAKLVIPRAGYQHTLRSVPTKRMAQDIVYGHLDLWIGLATLPEFEETTEVGHSIVHTIEMNIYWRGNQPPVYSREDLDHKSVIIMHGYSYGGWINYINNPENNIRTCNAFSHETAIKMLNRGRCDYLLNYTGPMKKQLKTTPIESMKSYRLSALPAKFVVSKERDDAEVIVQRLEKAYAKLVAEGLWPLKE